MRPRNRAAQRRRIGAAPFRVKAVDPHDPQPPAIVEVAQAARQQIARGGLFGRGNRVLQIEDDRIGRSSRAFSSARSFEAGMYRTERQGRIIAGLTQFSCARNHDSATFGKPRNAAVQKFFAPRQAGPFNPITTNRAQPLHQGRKTAAGEAGPAGKVLRPPLPAKGGRMMNQTKLMQSMLALSLVLAGVVLAAQAAFGQPRNAASAMPW